MDERWLRVRTAGGCPRFGRRYGTDADQSRSVDRSHAERDVHPRYVGLDGRRAVDDGAVRRLDDLCRRLRQRCRVLDRRRRHADLRRLEPELGQQVRLLLPVRDRPDERHRQLHEYHGAVPRRRQGRQRHRAGPLAVPGARLSRRSCRVPGRLGHTRRRPRHLPVGRERHRPGRSVDQRSQWRAVLGQRAAQHQLHLLRRQLPELEEQSVDDHVVQDADLEERDQAGVDLRAQHERRRHALQIRTPAAPSSRR